ncbi:MAG TPA: DMT family transporter [Actinomycetes bacterium]|jgi:drug/metabolite transporter (DMT)-like permease|nr:DMT family transporter [Actinomycetes bacterium]
MTRRAWLMFAAVSLLWGVPYLFIKVAVGEVPPVTVVFVRVALAASLLLPLAARRGALRGLARRFPALVVLSLLEIAVPFVLISMGEQRISSSLTGLLIAALPLFVALLALRFDRAERVGGLRLLGLLLGIGGVALLLGLDVVGDAGQLVGAVLVLLATLCYAASTLVIKRSFSGVPMLGVVAVATAVATVLLAPPALALTPARLPGVEVVLSLSALGVLCTAAALVLYFGLIVEAGPSRAAVITYLNPAVAVILGVAILGEPLTPAIVLGFLLIIAGSLLATQSSRRREIPAPAKP